MRRSRIARRTNYGLGQTDGTWRKRWRKALGLTKKNNERTYQLLLTEASQAGADALKATEWSEEEIDFKRRNYEERTSPSIANTVITDHDGRRSNGCCSASGPTWR